MDTTGANLVSQLTRLAADHGLQVDSESLVLNELGLDFRVAIAQAADGERWVLRVPRRAEVMERADVEGRLLAVVAPHLRVRVPDWRIHTQDLIAYPLLPGEPGLEITSSGELMWNVDVSSEEYALSMGDLLADLHTVDADAARAAGVESREPGEVREQWRTDINTVAAEFAIAPDLADRWQEWLAHDSYWPEFSAVTHGEIYPAHTLVQGGHITAVLDWTTAEVGDPARDFAFHHTSASAYAFGLTVKRYAERGGRVWPKLREHAGHIFSASPVKYGLYALITGEHEHREAAAAALNPPTPQ